MNDSIEPVLCEEIGNPSSILALHLHEREVVVIGQQRKPRFLESRIVEVVEVIETDHFLAAFQEFVAGRRPDEPGGTRDEDARCPFAPEGGGKGGMILLTPHCV